MTVQLADIQREIERLNPEERKRLLGFLVSLEIRQDAAYRQELTRRLDDTSSESWIRLEEAEQKLEAPRRWAGSSSLY